MYIYGYKDVKIYTCIESKQRKHEKMKIINLMASDKNISLNSAINVYQALTICQTLY